MSQTEVQLIKDAVIVNADISNSAAIDVSKISGAMPLAGGSFTDDVTFTGASANIVFDKSDNALEFADNAKATFGTGGDLEITHDGSHSRIVDGGTGGLKIQSDALAIDNAAGTETMAAFTQDGSVQLRHNNSTKFETTSTGATVTGNLLATGVFQNDTGGEGLHNTATGGKFYSNVSNDTRLEHSANAQVKLSFIATGSTYRGAVSADASAMHILTGGSGEQVAVKCIADGATELYHNGTKKFETTSTGINVTGKATFPDGNSNGVVIGDSSDLKLFHNGSHTFVENVTGNLNLTSTGAVVLKTNSTEDSVVCNANGSVDLYHDNSKKFETLSDGVNVTGTLKVNGSAFTGGKILQVKDGGLNGTFSSNSTSFVNIGLSESITPSSTSSKILVLAMLNFGSDNNGNRLLIRLVRTGDDNILVGTGSGSRTRASAQYAATDDGDQNNVNLTHLDSPSTTSSITYQVQCKVQSSSGSIKFGASGGDGNSSIEGRTPQRIILMEVSG